MTSVGRNSTQLTMTKTCSNSNSERFNSCSVYFKTGYPYTVASSTTGQEYHHSLLPAVSKKPIKCKLQCSSTSPWTPDVAQSFDCTVKTAHIGVTVEAEFQSWIWAVYDDSHTSSTSGNRKWSGKKPHELFDLPEVPSSASSRGVQDKANVNW